MLEKYLEHSTYIDYNNAEVQQLAKTLSAGVTEEAIIVKKCFEWVRDEIKHSIDYKMNPVTLKASDVLKYGTGFCYAKSHLLAALLRANDIPTGLCYQRLVFAENDPRFCLHGLNAVYLKEYGWYRIDARGNKPGVDAQFSPPVEKLAFPVIHPKEADFREIWHEPLPVIVAALSTYKDYESLVQNLPDVEVV